VKCACSEKIVYISAKREVITVVTLSDTRGILESWTWISLYCRRFGFGCITRILGSSQLFVALVPQSRNRLVIQRSEVPKAISPSPGLRCRMLNESAHPVDVCCVTHFSLHPGLESQQSTLEVVLRPLMQLFLH